MDGIAALIKTENQEVINLRLNSDKRSIKLN